MIRVVNQTNATVELYPYYDAAHGITNVCLVKASFRYDLNGKINAVTSSEPIIIQDHYVGFPNASSVIQAQENMVSKSHSELLCYGRAYPAEKNQSHMTVGIGIGFPDGRRWQKVLAVTGTRAWCKHAHGYVASDAEALKPLPLRYEYAYGGVAQGQRYAANPAGTGYVLKPSNRAMLLPHIEYAQDRVTTIEQQAIPAGFGPIPVSWLRSPIYQQLSSSVKVASNRVSMAPLDQCFSQPFHGGEVFELMGMHQHKTMVRLLLPSLKPCLTLSYHGGEHYFNMSCDTVVIDTEKQQLNCVWRRCLSAKTKYKSCLVQMRQ